MRYAFVSPAGAILRTADFDAEPAPVAASKGRWLPDAPPAFDPAIRRPVRVEPVPESATAVQYKLVPHAAADVLARRTAELARIRYARETAGVVVADRRIQTDPASRSNLLGALVAMREGFTAETAWKSADGWVTVTLAEVETMARAVVGHVEACFSRERELHDQLLALGGDVAAIAALDLSGGWPV